MASNEFYIAELNISRLKAPLDSPQMKEFVDFLEPVNKFAEQSSGFVWRLAASDGTPSSYLPPAYEDEMIVTNLSVWKDIDSLKSFAYNSVHTYFLKNRKKWFDQMSSRQVVLWWLDPHHIPTLDEAKQKLQYLDEHGSTALAFTFQALFDANGNPWQKAEEKTDTDI